jgi:hypothetical protein
MRNPGKEFLHGNTIQGIYMDTHKYIGMICYLFTVGNIHQGMQSKVIREGTTIS